MREIKDIIYDKNNPDICMLDIYLPEDVENPPVYVYFHGGFLLKGRRNGRQIVDTARYLTSRGVGFVSVDYRLYPNAHFPDFIEDGAKAVAYILNDSPIAPCKGGIVVGGTSAGAYIAMMLFFAGSYLKNAGVPKNMIDGFFLDAGQPTAHFNVMAYDKGIDKRSIVIDETAPFYYLREDFEGPQPDIFLSYADGDMINREEQLKMLRNTMIEFNFPKEKILLKMYENETHCSYFGKDFYMDDMISFIKNAVRGRG